MRKESPSLQLVSVHDSVYLYVEGGCERVHVYVGSSAIYIYVSERRS